MFVELNNPHTQRLNKAFVIEVMLADAPYAGPYMCPYGCWGNGLCTLPGVNVNALPGSVLIDATNLLNTYGLTVDAVKAFSYVSGVATVYPFVDMITKVLGVLSFEGSGTCVCDEAYSGANCEILEKDTFLYDMTYYNISTFSPLYMDALTASCEFLSEF